MSDELPDPVDDEAPAVEGGAASDRRGSERRRGERRRYRRGDGRRLPTADPRGAGRRRKRRLALVLVVLAAIFFGYRAGVVAPRRLAEVEVQAARRPVAEILARAALPLLAVPGAGAPFVADPAGPVPLSPEDRVRLEQLDLRLAPSLTAAPSVGEAAALLGPVRLLLGRDRDARIAWQAALRQAEPEYHPAARVGLAVLALRAALRAGDEQDRLFALDHAEMHLDRVPDDDPAAGAAAFDRALIASLRGDPEAFLEQLRRLAELGRAEWAATLREASESEAGLSPTAAARSLRAAEERERLREEARLRKQEGADPEPGTPDAPEGSADAVPAASAPTPSPGP